MCHAASGAPRLSTGRRRRGPDSPTREPGLIHPSGEHEVAEKHVGVPMPCARSIVPAWGRSPLPQLAPWLHRIAWCLLSRGNLCTLPGAMRPDRAFIALTRRSSDSIRHSLRPATLKAPHAVSLRGTRVATWTLHQASATICIPNRRRHLPARCGKGARGRLTRMRHRQPAEPLPPAAQGATAP